MLRRLHHASLHPCARHVLRAGYEEVDFQKLLLGERSTGIRCCVLKNVLLHCAAAMLAYGVVSDAPESVHEEILVLHQQIELFEVRFEQPLIDAHPVERLVHEVIPIPGGNVEDVLEIQVERST